MHKRWLHNQISFGSGVSPFPEPYFHCLPCYSARHAITHSHSIRWNCFVYRQLKLFHHQFDLTMESTMAELKIGTYISILSIKYFIGFHFYIVSSPHGRCKLIIFHEMTWVSHARNPRRRKKMQMKIVIEHIVPVVLYCVVLHCNEMKWEWKVQE